MDQTREKNLVNSELEAIQNESAKLNLALAQNSLIMRHLSDPNTRRIRLEGTEKYPEQSAQVYWNSENSQTYIVMEDLAPAPEGLTYQLWAIVDGVPLDMGIYDEKRKFLEDADIFEADAFAITLETEGGNEVPNLDQLVVIGNV